MFAPSGDESERLMRGPKRSSALLLSSMDNGLDKLSKFDKESIEKLRNGPAQAESALPPLSARKPSMSMKMLATLGRNIKTPTRKDEGVSLPPGSQSARSWKPEDAALDRQPKRWQTAKLKSVHLARLSVGLGRSRDNGRKARKWGPDAGNTFHGSAVKQLEELHQLHETHWRSPGLARERKGADAGETRRPRPPPREPPAPSWKPRPGEKPSIPGNTHAAQVFRRKCYRRVEWPATRPVGDEVPEVAGGYPETSRHPAEVRWYEPAGGARADEASSSSCSSARSARELGRAERDLPEPPSEPLPAGDPGEDGAKSARVGTRSTAASETGAAVSPEPEREQAGDSGKTSKLLRRRSKTSGNLNSGDGLDASDDEPPSSTDPLRSRLKRFNSTGCEAAEEVQLQARFEDSIGGTTSPGPTLSLASAIKVKAFARATSLCMAYDDGSNSKSVGVGFMRKRLTVTAKRCMQSVRMSLAHQQRPELLCSAEAESEKGVYWRQIFDKVKDKDLGEVHKDNLELALDMVGFGYPDKALMNELIPMVTRYSTMGQQEFHKFIDLYTERQAKAYVEAFQKCDEDSSGTVDESELASMFEVASVHSDPMPHVLSGIFDEVCDADRHLHLRSFMKLCELYKMREGFSKEEFQLLQTTFKTFDYDQSGEIDCTELAHMLYWLGYSLTMMKDVGQIWQVLGVFRWRQGNSKTAMAEVQAAFDKVKERQKLTPSLNEYNEPPPADTEVINISLLPRFLRLLGYRMPFHKWRRIAELLDMHDFGWLSMRQAVTAVRMAREQELGIASLAFKKAATARKEEPPTLLEKQALEVLRDIGVFSEGMAWNVSSGDYYTAGEAADGEKRLALEGFQRTCMRYGRMFRKTFQANGGMTTDEVAALRRKFANFGKDKSPGGKIGNASLASLLQDVVPQASDAAFRPKLLRLLEEATSDEDHESGVDFQSFCRLVILLQEVKQEELLQKENETLARTTWDRREVAELRSLFLSGDPDRAHLGLPELAGVLLGSLDRTPEQRVELFNRVVVVIKQVMPEKTEVKALSVPLRREDVKSLTARVQFDFNEFLIIVEAMDNEDFDKELFPTTVKSAPALGS